jgi:hypothetical protein
MDSINYTDYKEGLEALYRSGFTTTSIARLADLRRTYRSQAQDQAPADLARLRFIRWLVAQGRLSDQLP